MDKTGEPASTMLDKGDSQWDPGSSKSNGTGPPSQAASPVQYDI